MFYLVITLEKHSYIWWGGRHIKLFKCREKAEEYARSIECTDCDYDVLIVEIGANQVVL